jgi:hypothetical protein
MRVPTLAERAAARPARNPHRAKALAYRRDRLHLWWVASPGPGQPATGVHAVINPAPGDPYGVSVTVNVWLRDGIWECEEHPGANSCAHRLAVQGVTGHGHLGGRWAS